MQTRLITLGESHTHEAISEAASIIRSGGLVAFPTETVYGLGANGLAPASVRRIFEAKGRPPDNPLILHVASVEALSMLAESVPDLAAILIRRFWPGPLTMVFRRKGIVPLEVTGGLDTVAVRMPDNEIALSLISASGVPVAAPSANRSGRPSPTTAQDVLEDMAGRIECIIDGGRCRIGVESTVLDVTEEVPILLRPGGVTLDELRATVSEIRIDPHIRDVGSLGDGPPRSPGMKYRHYAPKTDLVLFEGDPDRQARAMLSCASRIISQSGRVGAAVCSGNPLLTMDGSGSSVVAIDLGRRDRLDLVSANLFAALRALDREGVDCILVEGVDEAGVGFAIMNRLRRAAMDRIVKC